MCMSSSPAKFSATQIYVGESEKDGRIVHVIAYQNNASSDHEVPNAMVLPFPTEVAMTEKNIINTSKFKGFLKDITDASKYQGKTLGTRRSMTLGAVAGSAEVFDVGSYTVVLATNVNQIEEALERVPEAKRPVMTGNLLHGLGQLYPDQPIAVCCWKGTVKAEPLLWWYEPKDQSTLFVPTMDSHDGLAPRLDTMVDTDHTISVGTTRSNFSSKQKVVYKNNIPSEARQLLPHAVWGTQLPHRLPNADMFVKTADLIVRGDGKFHVPDIKRGSPQERSMPMYGWS